MCRQFSIFCPFPNHAVETGVLERIEDKLRGGERSVFTRFERFYIADQHSWRGVRRNRFESVHVSRLENGPNQSKVTESRVRDESIAKKSAGPVSRFRKVKKITEQIGHAQDNRFAGGACWKIRGKP